MQRPESRRSRKPAGSKAREQRSRRDHRAHRRLIPTGEPEGLQRGGSPAGSRRHHALRLRRVLTAQRRRTSTAPAKSANAPPPLRGTTTYKAAWSRAGISLRLGPDGELRRSSSGRLNWFKASIPPGLRAKPSSPKPLHQLNAAAGVVTACLAYEIRCNSRPDEGVVEVRVGAVTPGAQQKPFPPIDCSSSKGVKHHGRLGRRGLRAGPGR